MTGEPVALHAGGFVHLSHGGRAAGLHALPLHKLVVQSLQERDAAHPRPALSHVAARVGISSSRLSHLFAASTGITLRSWLSFGRVMHSIRQLAPTTSLAALAIASGFADQPHLTRVWRDHFGRTPTAIRSAIVQDAARLAR